MSRGLAPAIEDEDTYGTSGKDMAGRLIFDVPATITYDWSSCMSITLQFEIVPLAQGLPTSQRP